MGLDVGFKLRIKNGIEDKDIKTKEQYKQSYVSLLTFVRPSEIVDELIMNISKPKDMVCYLGASKPDEKGQVTFDVVKYTKPEFSDTDFDVDLDQLKILLSKIKPLERILAKYSDRIIDQLVQNFEDKEIAKADRTAIKDLLFDIDQYASYEDLFDLLRLYRFFSQFFQAEINTDYGLKADLIYWRWY